MDTGYSAILEHHEQLELQGWEDRCRVHVGTPVRPHLVPTRLLGTVARLEFRRRFHHWGGGAAIAVLSDGSEFKIADLRPYVAPKIPSAWQRYIRAKKRLEAAQECLANARAAEMDAREECKQARVAYEAEQDSILPTDNPLRLLPRAYDILVRRMDGQTLAAIGVVYGLSAGRIRQIEQAALRRLSRDPHKFLPKCSEHIPIWDRVFASLGGGNAMTSDQWRADPALAVWEEQEG